MSFRTLAITLALFASTPAIAGGWTSTFPGDAVESHVGDDLPVIVVAADSKASAAATALRGALTDAGSPLVMDESAIGDVAGKGDSEIAAAAANLPVDRVVVVRVFPGKGAETAVVSVFKKGGAAAGSFSVAADKVLAAKGGGAVGGLGAEGATSKGVSSAAVAAVESLHLAKGSDEAKQAFLEKALWFQGHQMVYVDTGAVASSWSTPMRGKYGEELTWQEFLETAGRGDLSQRLTQKEETNAKHMPWVAGGLLVGSAAVIPAIVACGSIDQDTGPTGCLIGAGLTVGGFWALGHHAGQLDKEEIISLPDARRLADEYNKALLLELGLSEQDFAMLLEPLPPRPRERSLRLTSAGAVPVRSGFALGLTGRF